jgi:hypothetical protein
MKAIIHVHFFLQEESLKVETVQPKFSIKKQSSDNAVPS